MSTPFVNLVLAALVLALFQALAAVPWVWVFDGRPFRQWITDLRVPAYFGGGTIALAVALAFYMQSLGDVPTLEQYGRYYGIILHIQLVIDFVVVAPRVLLVIWPKGGAIASAAYREALRAPMFWLILALGKILILVAMVLPYFTLGDDYKLMKQVGFDTVMLFSGLFGLLTASITVNEEIEGRTAITVISKPVSRRQFFIGKYLGILMACWAMVLMLGVTLTVALYLRPLYDPLDDIVDPMPYEVTQWLSPKLDAVVPTVEGSAWARGMANWLGDTGAHHLGLVRIFGQVMILLSICTALATRMQFVVNLVLCLGIFLIGNLSPIMVHVTSKPGNDSNPALQLVRFIAQLFNAVFPSLDSFDMGPAIIRDTPLSTISFIGFVATVLLYALIYTAVSILAGLLLFEDRDLA
jgi:ABC-type transport system involved in multi-copper enzyme maturation permease subunit